MTWRLDARTFSRESGRSALMIVGLVAAVTLVAVLLWPEREAVITEPSQPVALEVHEPEVQQPSDVQPEVDPAPVRAQSTKPSVDLPADLAAYRDFSLQYVDLATWNAYLAKAAELGYDVEAIHSEPPDVRFESFEEGERFIRMTEQTQADNTRLEDRLELAMRVFPGNQRLDPDVRGDRILNPEGKVLDDDQVAYLLELDRADRELVRQIVEEEAWDMFRLVRTQAFDRRLYTAIPVARAPGAVLVRPSLGRQQQFMTLIASPTWTFGIQVFAGEIPELDELIAILDPLRLRRKERLRAAIAAM
jgi:hypothetical protein